MAKALALIEKERRGRWAGLVLLAMAVTAFEAVSMLLVFALLSMIANPEGPLTIPLLGDLRSVAPGVGSRDLFLYSAGFTGAFFALRGFVLVLQSYLYNRMAWNIGVRLSARLNHGYLAMPYSFHLRRNSSELIRNSYQTVNEVVGQVLMPAVLMISEALIALALIAILVGLAPVPTLLALMTFGMLSLVLIKSVQPRLHRVGKLNQSAAGRTYRAIQQGLHGIREIRVLGREAYFEKDFLEHRRDTADAQVAKAVFSELPRIILETAIVLSLVSLLAVTVARGGAVQETLAILGVFAYAVLRMMPSLNRVFAAANNIKFGLAALDIVSDELAMLETKPVHGDDEPTESVSLPLRQSVLIEGVSFRYDPAGADAVRAVNLRIRRGESVGFVGPTGGGKTTLLDLILGLLPPSEGQILVDGTDIRECTRAWQRSLGVVHQSVFLLDDTLRRNIALGIDDEDIDESAVGVAIRLAHLDEFVRSLPQGLDTVVGERGVRLSGGQRQRVAIARALYRRPSVLVFDEGTSALDNVTEGAIMDALATLRGTHTIIMVAHRLSTVRNCDWIAVVDGGQVTATGSFDQLLEQSASFRNMVR